MTEPQETTTYPLLAALAAGIAGDSEPDIPGRELLRALGEGLTPDPEPPKTERNKKNG